MKITRNKLTDKVSPTLLEFEKGFVKLISINKDEAGNVISYTYDFTYNVDRIGAVRHNVKSVSVSILSEKRRRDAGSLRGPDKIQQIDPKSVRRGIIMNDVRRKETRLANTVKAIANKAANVQLGLSQNVVNVIRDAESDDEAVARLPVRSVITSKNVDSLTREGGASTPVLKMFAPAQNQMGIKANVDVTKAAAGKLQSTSVDMILNKGVDPSSLIDVGKKVITTRESYGGIKGGVSDENALNKISLTPKQTSEFFNLLDFKAPATSNDVVGDVAMPVVASVVDKKSLSNATITIDAKSIVGSTFFAEFRVLDTQGVVLLSKTQEVKHKQYVDVFNTPRVAPRVSASSYQIPGRNTIHVQQLDGIATSVRIYKKRVSKYTNFAISAQSQFSYAGELSVARADGDVRFTDITNNTSAIVYRFIPVGPTGRISAAFTNVVVKGTGLMSTRRRKPFTAAINATSRGDTVVIRVTNIADGPIAMGIKRRNLTNKEREFEFVEDSDVIPVGDAGSNTFIDRNVRDNAIYEYRLVIYHDAGDATLTHVTAIHEHENQDNLSVQIDVSEPVVGTQAGNVRGTTQTNSAIDVTFSVRSLLPDTDAEKLRNLLKARGLDTEYTDELIAEREKFSELVAHTIQRYNTATGELEDFGAITGNAFSDADAGSRAVVKPLQAGVKYRYIITTLLRTPETLFENFEKTSESKQRIIGGANNNEGLNNREYKFKPSKWLHPITRETGTITTPESRKSLYAHDELTFGKIGNTKVVEIVVPDVDVKLANPTIKRFDQTSNLITWKVVSGVDKIDYFIVTVNNLGTAQVIQKVHADVDTSTYEIVHDVSNTDPGTATYSVHAMLTDYRKGVVVESAPILI